MPVDALLALQTSVSKTTTFNGASISLPEGTPRRGLKARVIYSAGTTGTGTATVTFSVDVYETSTWYTGEFQGVDTAVALSTTATASGEIFIPFETAAVDVRLTATFAGTGGTQTLTYFSDVCLAHP
jgi:hypothetical protein